jgi:ankyrin repeat protein
MIPPLVDAAYNGDVAKVQELLSAGANVNDRTSDGQTPLMTAAQKGYDESCVEVVKLLLKNGADVNATDTYGSSALRLAQRKGLTNMVNLLTSHGGKYLGA